MTNPQPHSPSNAHTHSTNPDDSKRTEAPETPSRARQLINLAGSTDENALAHFFSGETIRLANFSEKNFRMQFNELAAQLGKDRNEILKISNSKRYKSLIKKLQNFYKAHKDSSLSQNELSLWTEFFLRKQLILLRSNLILNKKHADNILFTKVSMSPFVIKWRKKEIERQLNSSEFLFGHLETAITSLSKFHKENPPHNGLDDIITIFKQISRNNTPKNELKLATKCVTQIELKLRYSTYTQIEPQERLELDEQLSDTLNKAKKFPWGKALLVALCATLAVTALATLFALTGGAAIPVLGLSLLAKQLITGGLFIGLACIAEKLWSPTPLSKAAVAASTFFAKGAQTKKEAERKEEEKNATELTSTSTPPPSLAPTFSPTPTG